MKICSVCEVEFEVELEVCPLCNHIDSPGSEKHASATDHDIDPGIKVLKEYSGLSGLQKRKLFWEISAMVLISGILVTAVIDLITTKGISWSKYSITVCMVLFVNITLISFLRHKFLLLLLGSLVTTSVLLVLLDVYNGRMGGGTQLGIPLLFSFYLVIYILFLLFRYITQHGFNMLGYIFLAIGVLALGIDSIVTFYLHHEPGLRWSLIVLVCIIPVAALLFYIHYRLNKGAELRRFFHI